MCDSEITTKVMLLIMGVILSSKLINIQYKKNFWGGWPPTFLSRRIMRRGNN